MNTPPARSVFEETTWSGSRLTVLDGIRGSGMLMVSLAHFYGLAFGLRAAPTLWIDRFALNLTEIGWIGLDLFFVMSGFLITDMLYAAKTRRSDHYFRNFYARRFLRIFPLYYGFLIFMIFLAPWVLPERWTSPLALDTLNENQIYFWTYTVNWAAAWKFFDAQIPLVQAHFWSLALEEQFYIIWPAFVLLLSRRSAMVACAAIAVASLPIRILLSSEVMEDYVNRNAAQVLTFARMDTLAIGGFLALAARGRGEIERIARWGPLLVAAGGSILVALFITRDGLFVLDTYVKTIGFSAMCLASVGFLAMTLRASEQSLLHRFLSNPVLLYFGKYSYAMYIFQLTIAFQLAARWYPRGFDKEILGSQIPMSLVFVLAGIGISALVAFVAWNGFEKHFMKLKVYFPYGRPNREAAAVDAATAPLVDGGLPGEGARIPAP